MSRHPLTKGIWAWCMYDWANSAFATTVSAAFFPVFFKTLCSDSIAPAVSTARLGTAISIGALIVAVCSPMLGALADAGRAKKFALGIFAVGGALCTLLLFFIGRGSWLPALVVFIAADICFACSYIFYDSLLTDIADAQNMDFISSLGYAVGYMGGGILLLVNILMVMKPAFFGLADAGQALRFAFALVAGWWALFSLPLLLFVKERGPGAPIGTRSILADAFKRLGHTGRKIIDQPLLWRFLFAYWLYIGGLYTFMRLAVDFGLSIGLHPESLMIALAVVQFVAFPAALGFGALAQKIGTERTILGGILVYTVVIAGGAWLVKTDFQYIVLAAITGMAQGGIQALSRSYLGKIIPAEDSAEYFGFYSFVNKAALVFGPLLVGLSALTARHFSGAPDVPSRIGLSCVVVLFVAGGIMLSMADRFKRTQPVM